MRARFDLRSALKASGFGPITEDDPSMALRLSTAASVRASQPAPIDFGGRAQALLGIGDFDGYRLLFAEAAEVEDIHRRYKARKTLAEQALAAARAQPRQKLAPIYLALAQNLVDLLEGEPREPVLLNLLGVALHELGSLRGAEDAFRAAARLDPALPHVASNIAEVTKRRKLGARPPALPPAVARALSVTVKRARELSARAEPARGLKLSLCMIVKDEQEMLPRCLEAAAPAVDEIVVVDTGSSDRTVEIARSYGARVVHHEWNGSFADARNVSVEAATGDWLIYLDADEVLVAEDAPRLRELTGHVWREAFFLVETNYTGDLEDGMAVTHNAMRVWRNRPQYRFQGRLHEQFAAALPGYLPERVESTTIRVEHFGYLGVVRDAKEKGTRNIELLERQAHEGTDGPFQAFNLGSEYGAIGDGRRAVEHLEKAWKLLADDPGRTSYPYVPSLTSRYVRALRSVGEPERATRQADEGLELFPGFTDLVFEQAICARDSGELERAAELLESCLEMGDAPAQYSATVGCGSYLALTALAEVRIRLGRLDEAEQLLERCLDEHPGFLGSIHPLAALRLKRGADPEALADDIERRVREATPSVRFMLGVALYEAGEARTAERQFRLVVERQPSNGPALVALAEALLTQERLAEAAEVAGSVGDDDPCAAAARRSQLFALLLDGALDAADRVLSSGTLALGAQEAEVFAAWHQAALGGTLPQSLPSGSAELLLTVLEALLRLRAIDAFARLLPLVERAGLPVRERRERLATMYLRRGFLDSAADEWVSACRQLGPDIDAMLGLAQVAVAKELPEDALNFAREARNLTSGGDSRREAADRLVEHLETLA